MAGTDDNILRSSLNVERECRMIGGPADGAVRMIKDSVRTFVLPVESQVQGVTGKITRAYYKRTGRRDFTYETTIIP